MAHINICRRDCDCCGEPSDDLCSMNLGTTHVEICRNCLEDLYRQIGEVIKNEKEKRGKK